MSILECLSEPGHAGGRQHVYIPGSAQR